MAVLAAIPNWTWSRSEETWEAQLQNLKEVMKKRKGKVPSQSADEKDPKVKQAARFLNNQRTLHIKRELPTQRQEMLDGIIDDHWNVMTTVRADELWEAQLRNLREVMKKRNGKLPTQSADEKDPEVKQAARFVNNQRSLYMQEELDGDRAEILSAIAGWSWTDNSTDQCWEAQVRNLREVMKKRKGKLPSQSTHEKDPKVKRAASFIRNQRTLYKEGALSDSRAEELSAIDSWTWNATDTSTDPCWEAQVRNLRQVMKKRKGELPTQSTHEKDPKVKQAAWFVNNQRRLYKQGKMSDSRAEELSDIDNWTWEDNCWAAQFRNLREVVQKCQGKLPSRSTHEKDPKVKQAARFVNNQRTMYKQGKLSETQEEQLSELDNWTWTASSTDRSRVVKRPAAALSA